MPRLARDFVGYGKDPPKISWPGEARLAISVVVNVEEGSERSPARGDGLAEPSGEAWPVPPGARNLINESLYGYGSRVGYWRLLEILDKYEVKATFFACAMALEQDPAAAREITLRGHEPCGHGYRWLPLRSLSLEEQRTHIERAVEGIARTTGERPLGWFSWGPSEHTREMLVAEGGFVYDCDSFADDLPYFVRVGERKWLVIPYDLFNNDGMFSRPPGYSEPYGFYLQLKASFDRLYDEGRTCPKLMSVGLHTRFAGRPGRASALEEFLRYVKSFSGVWFARRIDIARWWLENYGHLPELPRQDP